MSDYYNILGISKNASDDEIKGLHKKNGWIIDYNYIGDNVGMNFYIKSDGQIQYTSFNNTDWLSSSIKFRALTTSK